MKCRYSTSSKKHRFSEDKSGQKTHRSRKKDDTAKENKGRYPDEEQEGLPGTEREVHEEILARHYEGGAEPTPEAFARALKQWHQLPGTVVRPPTDVRPPAQKSSKSTDVNQASASSTQDAGDEKNKP